ncbi:YciI family protein [Klebsiella pneumoniae subsp. pneumoniae]|nr:YciI family protein [Klebsiella pneumoniae subsp. pneumoniae]
MLIFVPHEQDSENDAHLILSEWTIRTAAGGIPLCASMVIYLKGLIEQGKLLASGPLKNTPLRAGFLIFRAETRDEVQSMIGADPFARECLIAHLDIQAMGPVVRAAQQLLKP